MLSAGTSATPSRSSRRVWALRPRERVVRAQSLKRKAEGVAFAMLVSFPYESARWVAIPDGGMQTPGSDREAGFNGRVSLPHGAAYAKRETPGIVAGRRLAGQARGG